MAGRGRPRKDDQLIDADSEVSEEMIEDMPAPAPARKRSGRPGAKKVLDETGKGVADAGALLLTKISAGKDGKGLLFSEAQSITTPATRIAGRRLPKFLKQFAPKTKLSPADAADLEEILVTLGKYLLRLVLIGIAEWQNQKDAKEGGQQKEAVMQNAQRPTPRQAPTELQAMQVLDLTEPEQERVGVSSNGHNPAFSIIGADFGLGGE